VIKRAIRRALARARVDVRRASSVPFGVRWEDDVACCLDGRSVDVAIDVGAHFGETSRRLVDRFPGVRVHSFEPMPASFDRLQRAVAGLDVVCVQAAVGDHAGTASMGMGTSSFTSGFEARGETVQVEVLTLDTYAAQNAIESIALLKIDVEGHETSVLRGARDLLETGRIEYVLCECEFVRNEAEPHGDFWQIAAMLSELDYQIVSFYTCGVDGRGWRWGDVLFRLPERGQAVGWVAGSPYNRKPLRSTAARNQVHAQPFPSTPNGSSRP
jgi:FkbM family methyltransferase